MTQIAINLQAGVAIAIICNIAKQGINNILPPICENENCANSDK